MRFVNQFDYFFFLILESNSHFHLLTIIKKKPNQTQPLNNATESIKNVKPQNCSVNVVALYWALGRDFY